MCECVCAKSDSKMKVCKCMSLSRGVEGEGRMKEGGWPMGGGGRERRKE